jgi:plastocyanin
MTGRRTAGAIAVALLVLPSAAEAKTKTVDMGIPEASRKAFAQTVDVNAYFPSVVTINKGDKVRFRVSGFHSLDLPARGGAMTPLISPTGDTVSDSKDAAGAQFWFNGQDALAFTPSLLPPGAFGKKLSYNGSKAVRSGLPFANNPKPVTVTFKKKGRFTYFCNLHAGMKGTVAVKGKGAAVPSAKADRRAVKRQVATAAKTAKRLPDVAAPGNTINVGAAGKHGEELFAFVPSALTVSPGTTITFRMHPASYDIHTATTGPGNPESEPNSYLGQVAAGINAPVFDPRAVYRSEAPATTGTLTPTLHGNGFWNSGVLDTDSGTPLAASDRVTFGAPGTYDFYCLIHPFMKATVTVQSG